MVQEARVWNLDFSRLIPSGIAEEETVPSLFQLLMVSGHPWCSMPRPGSGISGFSSVWKQNSKLSPSSELLRCMSLGMSSPILRRTLGLGFTAHRSSVQGSPSGSVVKNPPAKQETWVPSLGQEDPWRRMWWTIPVFLPGKSHGQRSLMGCSPWGHKEWDTI